MPSVRRSQVQDRTPLALPVKAEGRTACPLTGGAGVRGCTKERGGGRRQNSSAGVALFPSERASTTKNWE